MKIKAVVWPGSRRIGCPDMQMNYGGDPSVLRFFDERFISEMPPKGMTVTLFAATEAEWAAFALAWAKAEPPPVTLH